MGQNVTINGTLAANGSIWTPNVYSSSTVQATAWMLSGSGSSGTYYFGNTGIYVTFDGANFRTSHNIYVPDIIGNNFVAWTPALL